MTQSPWSQVRGERGVALGLVIVTSIVFGVVAFGLLTMAMSRLRVTTYLGPARLRAAYAAEAGVVMAMQELWTDAADCAFGPYNLDTDNDGINDTVVTVTAVPCPAPGALSKLQAKVTF